MRIQSVFLAAVFCLLSLLLKLSASGQIVFQDNFDNGLGGLSWGFNKSGSDSDVNFAFKYSDIGIPSAPHSTGGTTIGMPSFAATLTPADVANVLAWLRRQLSGVPRRNSEPNRCDSSSDHTAT